MGPASVLVSLIVSINCAAIVSSYKHTEDYYIKINCDVIVSGYKQTEDNSASEFTPVLSEVRVARSLVFCEVFCGSLLLLFLLAIVLSVLPLTASEYLCGIF